MKKYLFFPLIPVVMVILLIIVAGCRPEPSEGALDQPEEVVDIPEALEPAITPLPVLLPDLVPSTGPNTEDFCITDPNNEQLLVFIKNQGSAPAGGSHVKVDFGQFGECIYYVIPIHPNKYTAVLCDIPPGCFDPHCHFTITVDVYDEVKESNEENNTQEGVCYGEPVLTHKIPR